MLTHTYLLQQIMDEAHVKNADPDIYIYNIAPDLLTIHPDISSNRTHSINRVIKSHPDHKQTNYIMFHLLVDDLAHYGRISLTYRAGFDPHSAGYTYLKGRHLIGPIMDLHKLSDRTISYDEAAYRSHLIIEMIYDLVILSHLQEKRSIELLEEAMHFTKDKRENEFCTDMAWLYGIHRDQTRDVLKNAVSYITKERMKNIMNIEGRIRLFTGKFGLRNDSATFAEAIQGLFQEALASVENEDFLQETAHAITNSGWSPTD